MSRRVPSRPFAVRCLAAGVALSVALMSPAVAAADKISDARAKAATVQAQIDALDMKASIADENYNQARDKFATVSSRARDAARRVAQLAAQKATLQTALNTEADQTYRGDGPLGTLAVLLSARTFAELIWTTEVMTRLSEQDAATVAALKRTEAEARTTQAALVASRTEAARAEKTMAANARAVRDQVAARQRVLDGIDAGIKTLLAQEQARQAAAARARYLAYLARHRIPPKTSSGTRAWLDLGGNPPSSARAATAVAWAKKAVGSWYVWAASGPSTFDCSGLTMWAYSHAGVQLPHSSRAQINVGRRVAKANLQPGDLVFFYSPIHHVGMYVGGGYFIHAPGTGRRVQYGSLASYPGYAGACRP